MSDQRRGAAIAAAVLASGVTLLLLDLLWLSVIAQGLYDSLLGALKRPSVYWPAALLFYAMYLVAVVSYAVVGASSTALALRRGAALGFVAYATYELTNWAVIQGWPALLVPIDILWGVALTAIAAFVGKSAQGALLKET